MIFGNQIKQSKPIGISFDNNLEVYGNSKSFKRIKKHTTFGKRREDFSHISTTEIKDTQLAIDSRRNNIDKLEEKEEKLGKKILCSREAVGILIHDNEYTTDSTNEMKRSNDAKTKDIKTNTDAKTDEIKNFSDKSEQIKGKSGSGYRKKDNDFDMVAAVHTEQVRGKSILGKNMEDILDIFFQQAEDPPNNVNQTNEIIQVNDIENKPKDDSKSRKDDRMCLENTSPALQTVHQDNLYDFLSYTVKNYGKIFGKNLNVENSGRKSQTSSCEPVVLEETLSDEENNHEVYCDDINLRAKAYESNSFTPNNTNRPKNTQGTTKYGKITSGVSSDRTLEFRRLEARRQSELDKVKFKEEFARSENFIPCNIPVEKGLFSDIIFFDENRKGIVTDRAIENAKKTGLLKLSNKSLTDIPDKVWSLNEKEEKRLSESTDCPDKWRSVLQTILILNLSFNKLKSISPKGSSFCSIKELRLNNNRIEELPNEIGQLHFLTYLNLSYNRLRNLPLKICSLKNLEELNLRRNFLEKLPDTFGNLANLRKTDLSFNKLTKLPSTFVFLSSLISLDLSFNELNQLPSRLMYLKKLETANTSYNYLSELPPLVDMRHLMYFDSTCNRLRHFPNFSGCIQLTELRLGINQIKEIIVDNLCRCPLINLMVPHNKIEVIPDEISVLTRLEILDVSDNSVLMLPWTLARLQHLAYVKVDNNKITNVKKSALEDSPQSVLEILRNRLILYEGKDSPILKQIAEKEKKEMKERREWDVEEKPVEQTAEDYKEKKRKRKKYKKEEIVITKVEKEFVNPEYTEPVSEKRNEPLDSTRGLIEKVLKKLPEANKVEFKESLTANRSLICKEMNLSDLSVNLIKVAGYYKVFKIDLSNNNFSFVPTRLKDLFNHLRELTLSNNNIKTIPDFFGNMVQLRVLDVSYNQLESFPLSMSDCNIMSLNARNNCFTKIPKVLFSVSTLEHVNFSRNKIKTIDIYGIKNWKRLSYLNLRNNLIEEVPSELGFLTNIRTLDLTENTFRDPTSQILKSGTAAVLKYLRYVSFKRTNGDLKNMVLF